MHKMKLIPKVLQHVSECQSKAFKEKIDYPVFVDALFNQKANPLESLVHCGLGIVGEAGEFADCIKKAWAYNDDIETLDQTNFIEELGDLAFYMQKALNMAGLSWDDIQAVNYVKLCKRFPDAKFTMLHASARLDKVDEVQTEMFEDEDVKVKPIQPVNPQPIQPPTLPASEVPAPAPAEVSKELGSESIIRNGHILNNSSYNELLNNYVKCKIGSGNVALFGKVIEMDGSNNVVTIHCVNAMGIDLKELKNLLTPAPDKSDHSEIIITRDGLIVRVPVNKMKRLELTRVYGVLSDGTLEEGADENGFGLSYCMLAGGLGFACLNPVRITETNSFRLSISTPLYDALVTHCVNAKLNPALITVHNATPQLLDVFIHGSLIHELSTINIGE